MKSFLRGGVLVFGATLIWQLSNFGFNVVGAHELGPEKFGLLASAMALSYLLNPVVNAVQTVTSRESTSVMVDGDGSHIRALVSYYITHVGWTALAASAAMILCSPLISRLFHLNSAVLVILFALVIPPLVASSIVRGVHQGTRYFTRYSLGTIVEGITKVGSAIVFLTFVWKSPISGLFALLMSAIAGLIVNLFMLRHFPKPRISVRPNRHPVGPYASALSVFGLLAILISADTITARVTLPAHSAGIYAALSLAGRVVYFATTSLTGFLFPMFSARFDEGVGTRRWLIVSVILVLGISVVVVGMYAWAPHIVIEILFGKRYQIMAPDMWLIGAIFSMYGVANLFVFYLLARREKKIQVVLGVSVAAQIVGFVLWHKSVEELMVVMAVAFGLELMGCAGLIILSAVQADRYGRKRADFAPVKLHIRGKHRAVDRGGEHRMHDGGTARRTLHERRA